MNRRGQMERLIETSDMRASDRAVFAYLVRKADNDAGQILPEYAWKASLEQITAATGLHRSNVAKSLSHLELRGWLARQRSAGGRRNVTRYVSLPDAATPCQCRKLSPNPVTRPMTGAERSRRYRARKLSRERDEAAGRRPRACPLCDQAHPLCKFAAGSLFCANPFCLNPHHRSPIEA